MSSCGRVPSRPYFGHGYHPLDACVYYHPLLDAGVRMFQMNGAESLIRALLDEGVECCFANPGTSEMHMVQGIDAVSGMRAVLGLFEGVCTGAADGYARMAGKPATTLLHLGAGLGNGIANLHNARRAGTPLINLIGDHAVHHVPYDAPLTANIEGIAAPVSSWVRTARTPEGVAGDVRDAVRAAMARNPIPLGNIATLIVPADCAWGPTHYREGRTVMVPPRAAVPAAAVDSVAGLLDSDCMLLLDGEALGEAGVRQIGRLVAATGASAVSSTFPARVDTGPGLCPIGRMPYFPEQARESMEGVKHLVLVGAEAPVSFFAYQDQSSSLVPDGCNVVRLAHRHEDVVGALAAVADAVGAPDQGEVVQGRRPELPTGDLTIRSFCSILAALAPEQSIVSGDSGPGAAAYPALQGAVRHTWLNLTGGAIGQGGPAATGAAVACPDRQVFALLGDGGAAYTLQCLWTQARESLDVVTVIFSNRSYGILDIEYRRLGINEVGATAASLFDLSNPDIDWVQLAGSMGVPGTHARTCDELTDALRRGIAEPGPFLVEVPLGR